MPIKKPIMKSTLALTAILAGFAAAESLPLIPLPVSLEAREGAFDFSSATAIRHERGLKAEADLLAADLKARTGSDYQTADWKPGSFQSGEIRLSINAAASLPAGGYQLDISPKGVV